MGEGLGVRRQGGARGEEEGKEEGIASQEYYCIYVQYTKHGEIP